jgi:hypothetical protein
MEWNSEGETEEVDDDMRSCSLTEKCPNPKPLPPSSSLERSPPGKKGAEVGLRAALLAIRAQLRVSYCGSHDETRLISIPGLSLRREVKEQGILPQTVVELDVTRQFPCSATNTNARNLRNGEACNGGCQQRPGRRFVAEKMVALIKVTNIFLIVEVNVYYSSIISGKPPWIRGLRNRKRNVGMHIREM